MINNMAKNFKMGLIQLSVGGNKQKNIERATKMVKEAASNGAKVIALPECWNSPYGTQFFGEFAEIIKTVPDNNENPSTSALSKMAKENNIYLIGGSVPEKDGGKIFNTSCVYNPKGELIAKHRKMHLFDIDVPGKIRFQESEVLSAGNAVTTFDTPYCKFGLGICYDIRFNELAKLLTAKGCHVLCYPGAFNMTTGPAHWELLQRARAVDNQLYVCAVSPARATAPENPSPSSYEAWGHSSMTDPWGSVFATIDEHEGIVYADIDLEKINEIRDSIPISKQKRTDVYTTVEEK